MTPQAKLQKKRQEAGLCRHCGAPRPADQNQFCVFHRYRQLVQQKDRRDKRVADGKCPYAGCNDPPDSGLLLCARHRRMQKVASSKWYYNSVKDKGKPDGPAE